MKDIKAAVVCITRHFYLDLKRKVKNNMRLLVLIFCCCVAVHASPAVKISLMQKGGSNKQIQFIEYITNVPSLSEFTVCYWLKTNDLSHRQTTFSYAAPNNPNAISIWIEPTSSGSEMQMSVNGNTIYSVAHKIKNHHWHYYCHSWDGSKGHWLLFINGEIVGQGEDTDSPHSIQGGGTIVFGQQQQQQRLGLFNLNADKTSGYEAHMGVEGEMTLMFFDSRRIHRRKNNGVSNVLGTKLASEISFGVHEMVNKCFDQPLGNIVAWGVTEMKLIGGATSMDAKSQCGDF